MSQKETYRVFRTVTVTEYVDIEASTGSDAEELIELLIERGESIDWSLIGDETNVKILYGDSQHISNFSIKQESDNFVEGNLIDLDILLEGITESM